MASYHNPSIVFYDGVCGLCNRFVNWLIRRDRKQVLRYASLQSPAAYHLPAELSHFPSPGTVVFLDNGKIYVKSDAVIRLLLKLKGIYRLAGAVYIIPRPLRDAVYDFVARNRYKWFGKYSTCLIPDPSVRKLFVDNEEIGLP